MSTLIYLDQNILSDLRHRKIISAVDNEFELLKMVLTSTGVTVVFSHVTLLEIDQIKSDEYKNEHLTLLDELGARYIEPLTRKLRDTRGSDIWLEYLDNKESNIKMGTSNLMEISQLTSRKISGLPISDSFEDINDKMKSALSVLIANCEMHLESINLNDLDEPSKINYQHISSQIPLLKEKSLGLEAPKFESSQPVGPKPFREIPKIKSLDIQKLPVNEVVVSIESAFKIENSTFNWNDYFEDTPQNSVARAYSLMNWAGYFADDFDKVTKRGDRFNASNNDMQHTISALGVDFLISNDNAFLKKSEACYAYTNQKIKVCTPKHFLESHCKFV